jgi:hypothetical protein
MSEITHIFRKAVGGWILQIGTEEEEEIVEEIFTDGIGLVNRICEIVGENEVSASVAKAMSERTDFLKDNAGKRHGGKPPG